MTPQTRLTAARNTGALVTVHLTGRRVLTGVVMRSALQDTFYVDVPGSNRTAFFTPDDVLDVHPA